MHTVYLILGSNLGNRRAMLNTAIFSIGRFVGEVVSKSKVYETTPWGIAEQPNYLNQVLIVKTTLDPQQTLYEVLKIEKELGRVREIKWGSRIIDIDILFYDDLILDKEELKVPHPLLHLRKFVLVPLVEITPNFVHPLFQATVKDLLKKLADNSNVKPLYASLL